MTYDLNVYYPDDELDLLTPGMINNCSLRVGQTLIRAISRLSRDLRQISRESCIELAVRALAYPGICRARFLFP